MIGMLACSDAGAMGRAPLVVGSSWPVAEGCAVDSASRVYNWRTTLITVVSSADCYYCRDHLAAFEFHGPAADSLGHRIILYAPSGRTIEASASLVRQSSRPFCVDTSGVLIEPGRAGATPFTVLVDKGRVVGMWRGGFMRPAARERFWQEVGALARSP